MKELLKKIFNVMGYKIERKSDQAIVPIDVLDLVLHRVASQVPDFFFIQVGANDGVSHDPLRAYITKYHWRGLLIEPLPDAFSKLVANYREEPQLAFENVAVAPRDGTIRIYTADGDATGTDRSGCSSLDRGHLLREVGAHAPIREIEVPALSVPTLLSRHAVSRIDLLQIDAEGYDFDIIKMFDLDFIKPSIINFEHVHIPFVRRQVCYRYLTGHGYRLAPAVMDTVAFFQPAAEG